MGASAGVNLIQRSADHVFYHAAHGGVAGRIAGDQLPIAQHCHAIRQVQNLIEPMRDVEDGDALCAQPVEMREEPFDFRRAQAGGRFVEDEQFRVAVECSGDGDFLLLRGREIAERPRGGNLKLASRKLRGGLSVQASPVHAAPAVTRPTFAEQEILGHGQVAAVRQLLMNRRDAGVDGVVRRREMN